MRVQSFVLYVKSCPSSARNGLTKNLQDRSQRQLKGKGNVFLIGTGPVTPIDLLTLKALKLMQSARRARPFDRLISTSILELVHAGDCLLYAGKTSGYHSRTQEEIHEVLLSFAESGATVLRLNGGDPLVFGRGGEEVDFLQEQGIRVQVVPGVTAASGIAAGLGIPLGAGEGGRRFVERCGVRSGSGFDFSHLHGLAAKLMSQGICQLWQWNGAPLRSNEWFLSSCRICLRRPPLRNWSRPNSSLMVALWRFRICGRFMPLAGKDADSIAELQAVFASENLEAESGKREPRVRSLRGNDPLLPSQN